MCSAERSGLPSPTQPLATPVMPLTFTLPRYSTGPRFVHAWPSQTPAVDGIVPTRRHNTGLDVAWSNVALTDNCLCQRGMAVFRGERTSRRDTIHLLLSWGVSRQQENLFLLVTCKWCRL
jgi:hypothetical protein